MRQAGNVETIVDDGVVHAILLTGAGCGQHEFGVDALLRYASIPLTSRKEGIGDRSSTEGVRHVLFETFKGMNIPTTRKKTNVGILAIGQEAKYYPEDVCAIAKRYLSFHTPIHGAWDDRNLCVVGRDETTIQVLAQFAESARRGDLAIWYGTLSKNPFEKPGLVMAIPSKVPDRHKRTMLEADLATNRLADAAAATGIKARVDEANAAAPERASWLNRPFGYHALAPGWRLQSRVGGLPIETEHEVMFFLTPANKEHNYGWFTIEELDAWLRGEGPVLKANFDRDAKGAQ